MEKELLGFLGVGAMMVLLALGVPVAFSLIIPSVVGFLVLGGWHTTAINVSSVLTGFCSDFTMSVVPVFIFMGELAYATGILESVYGTAAKWFGRLPGGLAISTVFANGIFAACSGSSIAACLVIGKSAIPEMEKAGYPPTLTYGVVTGAGTLAALIPPSILMCIYGLIVDTSIAELFMAGFLPGCITVLLYSSVVFLLARNVKQKGIKYSLKEKLFSLRHLWVVLVLLAGIMLSMYLGWATPTEAGAVGAVVVFFLALSLKEMTLSVLKKSVIATAKSCGAILIIVSAAAIFGRFLTFSGATEKIIEISLSMEASRYTIFVMISLIYLLLGCFLSATGMLVVSLPIFYPIMMKLGFDPIWFGIVSVIFCEVALETPPVGMNIYTVSSIAPEVSVMTIIKGATFFTVADILTVIVVTIFPGIVSFLPNLLLR